MHSWISVHPFLELYVKTWTETTLDGGIKQRWKPVAYVELMTMESAWVGHDSQDNEIGVRESNILTAKMETERLVFQKSEAS